MSSTPTKKPAPQAKPKPQIGKAALSGLMAAAGADTRGDPVRIPLADIREDPDQPRKRFSDAELDEMAESIRMVGVIQPIVVRPPEGGGYMLVAGARRFRAAKRAGEKDIPAIVRAEAQDNFAAQVIENTQRVDLDNSELAEAVGRFTAEGKTNKQIAAICNLKDWQITAFRKSAEFPPELRDRLDRADMRALYDLFRLWEKNAEAITTALAAFDKAQPEGRLTITDARRIAAELTGKPTGSIVLDRQAAPAPAPAQAEPPAPIVAEPDEEDDSPPTPAPASPPASQARPVEAEKAHSKPAPAHAEPARTAQERPVPALARPTGAPVFIVTLSDGTEGRLVVDRRAERDGRALVEVEGSAEEFRLDELTFLRIE